MRKTAIKRRKGSGSKDSHLTGRKVADVRQESCYFSPCFVSPPPTLKCDGGLSTGTKWSSLDSRIDTKPLQFFPYTHLYELILRIQPFIRRRGDGSK